MAGTGVTVKLTPLLATPAAFTTTLPVVAPAGTLATILVALQLVTVVAAVPPNVTELPATCDAPKLVPAMVIDAPTAPVFGVRVVIAGAAVTVKLIAFVAIPLTVTTTLPVVAPVGTITTMLVALQLVTDVAAVPLNVTVLVPCRVAPRFVPAVMVIDAPIAPAFRGCSRLVMVGAVDALDGPVAHPTSPLAKAATSSSIQSVPGATRLELNLSWVSLPDKARAERLLPRGKRHFTDRRS